MYCPIDSLSLRERVGEREYIGERSDFYCNPDEAKRNPGYVLVATCWPTVAQAVPELSAVIHHGTVAASLDVEDLPAILAAVETEFQLGRVTVRLHNPGADPDIIPALPSRGKVADGLACLTALFLDQRAQKRLGKLILHAGALLGSHPAPGRSGRPAGHVGKIEIRHNLCSQKCPGLRLVGGITGSDEACQFANPLFKQHGRWCFCLRCDTRRCSVGCGEDGH